MNEVIKKTYEFIDCLDESKLFSDLIKYRDLVISNDYLTELIKKANLCDNVEEFMTFKKEVLQNKDYCNYVKACNELNLILNKINFRYNMYLENRSCWLCE